MIEKECLDIINKLDFSSLKNKKILITGASGLIGIYMVSLLNLLREKNNSARNLKGKMIQG